MPGRGSLDDGRGAPRQQPTRVGGPDWNRDPDVSFDPSVARQAVREPGAERRPGLRDRLPSRPPARPGGRRPVGWGKRIGAVLGVLLLLILGFGIYLDIKMTRVDALASYEGQPSGGAGTNWLIVGSDSRAGLSSSREEQLSTGDADGNRTDTMMLVHTSTFGQTSLISLPRDSYMNIPGHGRNRLNAAYSIGGPQLLVQTVEQASGLAIDHYAEIGFEGFSSMVDAVGGVNMCLDEPLDDPKAGIDLPAGCQDLSGPNALGYVRSRAFPNADLQRVQNQRKFLAALISKAASPLTLLNPFSSIPFANAAIGTLTVDDSTHIWNLASLGWAMKSLSSGGGVTTTVPIELSGSVSGAVVWDDNKAPQLFQALRDGDDIPSDVITPG